MIKFLKYLFVILLVMFMAPLIFIQTDYAKNYVKVYLKETAKKNSAYTLELGDINLFPPFSFTAKEVKVFENGEERLAVDELKLKLSPFEIQDGTILLHSLELQKVYIAPPNSTNLSGTTPKLTDLPLNIEIESFKVHHLETHFKGLDTHEDPISFEGNLFIQPSIEHFNLNARFWKDSTPKETLQTTLEFDRDNGLFRINTSVNASLQGRFKLAEDRSFQLTDLKGKGGPLQAEGKLFLDKHWNILQSSVSISSLDLADVSPIHGKFTGEIELRGQLLKPEILANFASDKIQWNDHIFEEIAISINSQKKMSLEFTKEGQPYNFTSLLEWEIPLTPKAEATVDLADILQLFRIENSNISGQITCGIDFSQESHFGKIIIKDLCYESYVLGCSLKNIEADITLDADKLIVKKLKGTDTQAGQFNGSGEMDLLRKDNFPFEFRFDLNNTAIFNLDFLKINATGKGILKGNADGALLEGNLVTDTLHFTLPEKKQAVKNTVEITYINQSTEATPPTLIVKKTLDWPLELKLKVKTGEEALVDGKGLTSNWKGKAEITGTANKALINGELNCKEGSYLFKGKKIALKSGTVNFQGNVEEDTTLYIIGEMEIDRITAEIIVKGSTTNPSIAFRSTPPMSQREILSWILFNKGFNEISDFQGTQLNESITDLIHSDDSGPDLLTKLQNSLGLDRIEFSGAKDSEGLSIQIGKYISKKTFITLSHTSGSGSDTNSTGESHSVGIETILRKNIKLQAEVDDGGNGQANIIWKKNY
jgi:autotransporter translocation and assembly factor TamB